MKILVAGNLVNYGYYFTKLLRNEGIDADLLMQKFPGSVQDPKSFEKEMKEYPSWIRFWDNHNRNWKTEIIEMMKEYDMIHALTELPIFAMFSRKPYVAFPTGDDINELAFKRTVKGILLRFSYKRAKAVIYPGPYMHESVKQLKLKNAIFIAPPWDYAKFKPGLEIKNKTCIFFHPTNQVWKSKRNDVFLKAFSKLCKERDDIHLILIKRGNDFEKSLSLLSDSHCQGKYEVLSSTLNQNEISELYNKSDFIVDAFTGGSIGLIGQESMASAKPLISYIDKELYQLLYGSIPPILSCRTEDEILLVLRNVVEKKNLYNKIGIKSREWILKYHNPEIQIKKFIFIYESIIKKLDIESIKKTIQSM
jgi:glycosyltransferase involved in cell wall biosynthesis